MKDIIIEDFLCCTEKNGEYILTAKNSFYYKHLIENDQEKADAFIAYQKIYLSILNFGVLTNPDYCLYRFAKKDRLSFTFDLGKAQFDLDLKSLLIESIDDDDMMPYIDAMFNPDDSIRCSVCGGITFSLLISYDLGDVNPVIFCCHCNALDDEKQKPIIDEFKKQGCIAAVKKRIALYSSPVENYAITANDKLIDDFIYGHRKYARPNPRVDIIESIFDEEGFTDLEVFAVDEDSVAIVNRKLLALPEVMQKATTVSPSGDEILRLWDTPGVVYLFANAINFVKSITSNNRALEVIDALDSDDFSQYN